MLIWRAPALLTSDVPSQRDCSGGRRNATRASALASSSPARGSALRALFGRCPPAPAAAARTSEESVGHVFLLPECCRHARAQWRFDCPGMRQDSREQEAGFVPDEALEHGLVPVPAVL
eukprot:5435986-Pyramimonas_sp.AAC.1